MLAGPDDHLTDEGDPEQRVKAGYRHGGSYWGIGGAGRLEVVRQVDGGSEEEGDTHQSGHCASYATHNPFATCRHCAREQSCGQEQGWCV